MGSEDIHMDATESSPAASVVTKAAPLDPAKERLRELRQRHGYQPPPDGTSDWNGKRSKELLARDGGVSFQLDDGTEVVIAQDREKWPRNHKLYDLAAERLKAFGFTWTTAGFKDWKGKERWGLQFRNWPKQKGRILTATELLTVPLDQLDGFAQALAVGEVANRVGQPAGFAEARARMDALHVGYKAIGRVSWLPGLEPFKLPEHLERELTDLGTAIFLLADAVRELWNKDPLLHELLIYKVPERIWRLMDEQRLELVRPDLAIWRGADDKLHLVATELETAPAGEGMAHTMETGYEIPTTMLDRMVEYLDGRPHLVFMTSAWAEYIWEICVFVKALRDRGVDARVLFNEPLEEVHARVNTPHDPTRERLGLPQIGWGKARTDMPQWMRDEWEDSKDFLGRLTRYGFREFVGGMHPKDMPRQMGAAVVKRFGYFDNLPKESLELLLAWRRSGATIQNGLGFAYESKVMMTAAHVPAVRSWIQERNERMVAMLDMHLAETRLLHPRLINLSALKGDDPRREECRPLWLTKFPGYDGNEQSWGARSVEFGAGMTQTQWMELIDKRMELPHPVVAQHAINQEQFHVPYVDERDVVRLATAQRPRLTPFLLRGKNGQAVHAGSTMTFRRDRRVHGASEAIETPAIYSK